MALLLIQGIYYLITGLWPIAHIRSFMAVTGPKTDLWLVKTVGAITIAIACVLLFAYATQEMNHTIKLLPILSAAAFTIIDIYYPLKGVISKVYLIDSAIQILFILAWLIY
jgi:hypothetical protein